MIRQINPQPEKPVSHMSAALGSIALHLFQFPKGVCKCNRWWHKCLGPFTHVGENDRALGSWTWPFPSLAITTVKQQMIGLLLCVCVCVCVHVCLYLTLSLPFNYVNKSSWYWTNNNEQKWWNTGFLQR